MPSHLKRLLDTSICVHYLRGRHLPGFALAEGDCVALQTVSELYRGVYHPNLRFKKIEEERVAALLSGLLVVNPTEDTAMVHARLVAGLDSAGKSLGKSADTWIAAQAMALGCLFLHDDADFLRIDGLHQLRISPAPLDIGKQRGDSAPRNRGPER